MSDQPRVIGYQLVPIHAPKPGMVSTCALMTCSITGKILSHSGGGAANVISTEVAEKLFSPEGREFFGGNAEY